MFETSYTSIEDVVSQADQAYMEQLIGEAEIASREGRYIKANRLLLDAYWESGLKDYYKGAEISLMIVNNYVDLLKVTQDKETRQRYYKWAEFHLDYADKLNDRARLQAIEDSDKRLAAIAMDAVIENGNKNPNRHGTNWKQTARKFGAAALKTIFGSKNNANPIPAFT